MMARAVRRQRSASQISNQESEGVKEENEKRHDESNEVPITDEMLVRKGPRFRDR